MLYWNILYLFLFITKKNNILYIITDFDQEGAGIGTTIQNIIQSKINSKFIENLLLNIKKLIGQKELYNQLKTDLNNILIQLKKNIKTLNQIDLNKSTQTSSTEKSKVQRLSLFSEKSIVQRITTKDTILQEALLFTSRIESIIQEINIRIIYIYKQIDFFEETIIYEKLKPYQSLVKNYNDSLNKITTYISNINESIGLLKIIKTEIGTLNTNKTVNNKEIQLIIKNTPQLISEEPQFILKELSILLNLNTIPDGNKIIDYLNTFKDVTTEIEKIKTFTTSDIVNKIFTDLLNDISIFFKSTDNIIKEYDSMIKKLVKVINGLIYNHYSQARHDQNLALVLGPGFSHLCRARNDLRRAGLFFLIVMLGSPKLTFLTLPVLGSFTNTFDFFTSPRIGFPRGTFRPLYFASCKIPTCSFM